jgi:hypothetical protein
MIRTAFLAAIALVCASPRVEARPLRHHDSAIVGGRPAGCPRAYCGCGASLYLFGRIIPRLNLAASWFAFPRAQPAPKMAAVRRHHVFVLERHLEGDVWIVHDSNSGGHATRLHARSIAGYVIVNPFAALNAQRLDLAASRAPGRPS